MTTTITIKCPECGHENRVIVKDLVDGYNRPEVVACDVESGGCDNYFAYFPVVAVSARVVKLAQQFDEAVQS